MSLTWKDSITFTAVALIGLTMFALLNDVNIPIINSWSVGSFTLLIIALIATYIVGSDVIPTKSGLTIPMITLGVAAIIMAFINIILNNQILFIAIGTDFIALWLLLTFAHVFSIGTPRHKTILS